MRHLLIVFALVVCAACGKPPAPDLTPVQANAVDLPADVSLSEDVSPAVEVAP